MSKTGGAVSRHCSIINYLKHTDGALYELIQDLCIGRMLIPKRGSPGLTFLRPDKALLKQLDEMASGDDPEPAVLALQSMVLLDYISSIKEFDDKKSDIPTYLRKKLPVASVDGQKVILDNGAEITLDKTFHARKDRGNIAVYILSKAFVPTDTAPSTFSNSKPKKGKSVTGGATYSSTRTGLFNDVCGAIETAYPRDPALEVLVSIMLFLNRHASTGYIDSGVNISAEECKNALEAVQSHLSYDTLATLAIVLQPYKTKGVKYLSDDMITALSLKFSVPNVSQFCYIKDPVGYYLKQRSEAAARYTNLLANIQSAMQQFDTQNYQGTFTSYLDNVYGVISGMDGIPLLRKNLSKAEHVAEAELRVRLAVANDNEWSTGEKLAEVQKCNLNSPYACSKADLNKANIAHFISVIGLLGKSNGIFYLPGFYDNCPGLEAIASNHPDGISIDKRMVEKVDNSVMRDAYINAYNAISEQINADSPQKTDYQA